ncbi:glycoside hydrolase family 25 protein [Adhaeretor mobilis]|nr:glycoside hydrolase family 25 protein [Adhaeretor mobilis]
MAFATAPAAAYVDGIDVSRWQSSVDWNSVKSDGIDFAFVKATEGVNFVDSRFHENMQGATAAGVHIGPYHFARIDSFNGVPFTDYDGSAFAPGSNPYLDAVSEANDFLDEIMPYYETGLYLPPVADVEGLPDFGNSNLEREFISNWVQIFSDTVDETLGRRPIIYTSKSGANTHYTSPVASTHDLWIAWWRGTGTTNPPVQSDTALWEPWQFWQWTATGSVNGVSGNVDRNVYQGSLVELEQLLIGEDPGSLIMLADFETDEGYFNRPTNYSGSNQGIGASSSAIRVTTEAHEGIGSQEIHIDGDPEGWFLRHVSGIGSTSANPETNLALDATGYIGFWLKTDDAGISVTIAIDDPLTADRGVEQLVIADGEWHLYEWNFEDSSQWEAWVNEEGIITGPTVTIDSIQFSGSGQATFYLDSVAHDPLGSLGPLAGDFDLDGDIDGDDLHEWQAAYGDGNGDGLDFLIWQQQAGSSSENASTAAIPEPAALLLLGVFAVGAGLGRQNKLPLSGL